MWNFFFLNNRRNYYPRTCSESGNMGFLSRALLNGVKFENLKEVSLEPNGDLFVLILTGKKIVGKNKKK